MKRAPHGFLARNPEVLLKNLPAPLRRGFCSGRGTDCCDYGCQRTEYLYRAITSILGAQKIPIRRRGIADEWRLYNRELVRTGDPHIGKPMTNISSPAKRRTR